MGIIGVRVSDEEREILERGAKMYNCPVSSMMKLLVFRELEREFDLQTVGDYEKRLQSGEENFVDGDEVWK